MTSTAVEEDRYSSHKMDIKIASEKWGVKVSALGKLERLEKHESTDLPLVFWKQLDDHNVTIQSSVASNHSINEDIPGAILETKQLMSSRKEVHTGRLHASFQRHRNCRTMR